MSMNNNIGNTPSSGHASPRRNAGSPGEAGRSSETARAATDSGKAREARSTAASSAADAVEKLPDGTRLEARILSITLAEQQMQQNLQLRSQQAALLALRLQLSQSLPGVAIREGTTLTATISAAQLSQAFDDSIQSAMKIGHTDDAGVLQRLRQAMSAQPFAQLRVSGGRLELLSTAALPGSTQARAELTLQSQQQSLAKWMPLQADTKASLRALLDLAGSVASATGASSSGQAGEEDMILQGIQGRLGRALASLTPPALSQLRTSGFLQQHIQGSGQFMEGRLATALSAATATTTAASGSGTGPGQSATSHPLRHFAMALKNALSNSGVDAGKPSGALLDSRAQMNATSTSSHAGANARVVGASSSSFAGPVTLPASDLKSAVIEALGLVLKLQFGAPASGEAMESQSGAGHVSSPQTAAQLVRLLRAEILKTLDTPTRLAGLVPDVQEQAAVSMLSRAALNINKDDSDKDTGEILKHLARLLARVQTNQLTSIQATGPAEADLTGSQTLLLDLPFLHQQAEMVTMLMERYPSSNQQPGNSEDKRYGYRIVLDFNFDRSDRITSLKSHIRYTEGTVSAAFWTGSEYEARIVATHLPDLRQELTSWGLTVGELSLQVGEAPPARQGIRKQILNERI